MMRLCQEMVPGECCDLLFPSLICPGDLPQYTDFPLRVPRRTSRHQAATLPSYQPPQGRQQGSTCTAPQVPEDGDLRIPDPEGANGITLHAGCFTNSRSSCHDVYSSVCGESADAPNRQ